MHALEFHSQSFAKEIGDYYDRRTSGKEPRKLKDLDPLRGYEDTEMAFDMEGNNVTPYVFKLGSTSHEVASIGVEWLYRCPQTFERDMDHMRFVLHLLREV